MYSLNNPVTNFTKFTKGQLITLKADSYNYDSVDDIYSINLKVYKIVSNTVQDISNSINKILSPVDNTKEIVSVNINAPNEDCILLCILNGLPNFIQIGTNISNYIYYYSNCIETRDVNYKSYSPIDELIGQGQLTLIGLGIYSYNITLTDYCILEIIDNISTGIEYDSIVYFNLSNNITNNTTGSITLQPNRFQMVAIPNKEKDIGYFIDLVNAKLLSLGSSLTANNVIQLTKAYPSNASVYDKYQVYVPGTSGESSKFKLMIQDGSIYEINPFFVKTGSFGSLTELTIVWNS